MKITIIVSILLLTIATVFPVWAEQAHHPQADGQPSTAVSQDKIDSSIMAMKESRMKMEMAPNQKERNTLMHKHMQQMKDCMKMMDMGDKEMMGKNMMGGAEGDMKKMMMESKMESKMQMMMEMMRGMMSQQEMMMKKNSN